MTFKRHTEKNIIYIITVCLLIVGLSSILFVVRQRTNNQSNASENPLQETENGSIAGAVTIGSDGNASGGRYIQFGNILPTPTTPTTVPPASALLGVATEGSALGEQKQIMETYGISWVTPENSMKMQSIGGCNGSYNFGWGDSLVAYAQAHGMKVHGHTMVWHGQTSSCASSFTLQQLTEYVTTVATHYCGQVYSFDVLNEAIDDGGGLRRDSLWTQKFGSTFIEPIYRAARNACPSMKLYYNDYNVEGGGKFDEALDLIVIPLKNKGLIDGFGFQTHKSVSEGVGGLGGAMNRIRDMGLEAAISEMDLTFAKDYTQVDANDLNDQANGFKQAATLCKNNSKCVRMTVWGTDDGHSWINGLDLGRGKHNDAPLLFNRAYQPKPAYCNGVQPILGTPRGAC